MDPSAASLWLSQMEMEDEVFNNDECNIMDYFDEVQMSVLLEGEEDFPNYFCPESNSINNSSSSAMNMTIPRNDSTSTICTSASIEPSPPPPPPVVCAERPVAKQRKNNSPVILTFGNPTTVPEIINHQQHHIISEQVLISSSSAASFGNLEEEAAAAKTTKKGCGRKRPQSQNYDHILAERKRREQLSQQFVALSSIVPGLKKMDKTSVLGDAINYLKHLQERVKTFEENSTKQTMESLVIVKKNQVFIEDEGSSDEMGSGSGGGGSLEEQSSSLPEIEAKVCDKSILVKVLCHKNKGVLVNLLSEIEKLNLIVTNTNVAQFGTLALDITIIAQMEQEFDMSMKDVIKRLQTAVQLSSD